MGTASPTHTVLLERARECHPCGGLQSAAGPWGRDQALSGHIPSFIRQSGGSPAQQWLQQLPCKGLLFSKGGVVGQVRLRGWKYLDDDFGSQAFWLLETGATLETVHVATQLESWMTGGKRQLSSCCFPSLMLSLLTHESSFRKIKPVTFMQSLN